MIELNPDIVRFIIDKAREFQTSTELDLSEAPESLEIDEWGEEVLAEYEEDLTYQELATTIDDLEPDQQISLVALMWLGRGDFSIEEWPEALSRAGEEHNRRTAQYLIATPLLADYLEEGLALHGYEDED
ncbi:MAG: DUF3775 domain-containing protein [Pseudomonadales bacterium]